MTILILRSDLHAYYLRGREHRNLRFQHRINDHVRTYIIILYLIMRYRAEHTPINK